jgi:hypothetical protein
MQDVEKKLRSGAYIYLPWASYHPSFLKTGFIIGELNRYVTHETSATGFLELRDKFYRQLHARGYPTTFLRKCFGHISFSMQGQLLYSPTRARNTATVLKIPYKPWTRTPKIKALMKRHLYTLVKQPPYPAFSLPVICWTDNKKLNTYLAQKSRDVCN